VNKLENINYETAVISEWFEKFDNKWKGEVDKAKDKVNRKFSDMLNFNINRKIKELKPVLNITDIRMGNDGYVVIGEYVLGDCIHVRWDDDDFKHKDVNELFDIFNINDYFKGLLTYPELSREYMVMVAEIAECLRLLVDNEGYEFSMDKGE